MKYFLQFLFVFLLSAIVLGCKQNTDAQEAVSSKTKLNAPDLENSSSAAALVDVKNKRKFIRTADLRFKVKNVIQSTYRIEEASLKFGGFVTSTHLQTTILNEEKNNISTDSTLITTYFRVENTVVIRVPNTKLDTVLKTISKQIDFLNYRIITAEDISLQMLSNEIAQKRSANASKRLSVAIDSKGNKLNDIATAEEKLALKKEENDAAVIQNLSLQDQIDFSTITLQIYQDEGSKQEMIANEKSIDSYRPNIGLQIMDSLKIGWFLLEDIISFIMLLWPILLFGFIGYFGYKKLKSKK